MRESTLVLAVVALIITVIILCPILTIYSINTLFGLSIPVSFGTWAAALWLMACIGNSHIKSGRD